MPYERTVAADRLAACRSRTMQKLRPHRGPVRADEPVRLPLAAGLQQRSRSGNHQPGQIPGRSIHVLDHDQRPYRTIQLFAR